MEHYSPVRSWRTGTMHPGGMLTPAYHLSMVPPAHGLVHICFGAGRPHCLVTKLLCPLRRNHKAEKRERPACLPVSNSRSEIQSAISNVIVNLPGREAVVLSQKADFVFGQAVLVYTIDEFFVVLGRSIDLCTMQFERLDDPFNVGRYWPSHELRLSNLRYHYRGERS